LSTTNTPASWWTTELKRVNIEHLAGTSQAPIHLLSVTLGKFTLKDLVVGVLDMKNVNRQLGTSMDGLLGEDILRRFRSVRINFRDKTLELDR
jgi:hypothetical protein